MTDPRPPAILVLAQGQADCVSESSKIRIRRALAYVEQFWKVAPIGCHGRERPKLIFAAGVGRKRSVLTLAERMAYFAAGERDRMGLPETSYDTICNCDDPTVWSTKDEVKWGFEHAKAAGTPRFVIVTNETHGKRALGYARSCDIQEAGLELVASNDDPPSPLHEFLSSLKPTLASIFGEERLQSVRRKHYPGG
jgi:hypothetical protein